MIIILPKQTIELNFIYTYAWENIGKMIRVCQRRQTDTHKHSHSFTKEDKTVIYEIDTINGHSFIQSIKKSKRQSDSFMWLLMAFWNGF